MSVLRQLLFSAGLLAAIAGWLWWSHHRLVEAQADAQAAQARAEGLSAQLTAAQKDARIVTRYVDRVHTVRVRGATLIQKVPVYVPQTTADAGFVNRGFIRLLNAAAEGNVDLPARAGALDAQPAGIGLDTVAGSVVGNYTTCHATETQLTSLQEWVRAHSAPASESSTGPP